MKTIIKKFIFFISLISCAPSHSSENIVEPFAPRIEIFKKQVNFENIMSRENETEYVDADWDKFPLPPQLMDWTITQNEFRPPRENGTRTYSIRLEKNKETLVMNVIIFPSIYKSSKYFLDTVNASTMFELPYVQGPADLGTISAIDKPPAPGDDVLWFYKNIFVKLTVNNTNISYMDVAYWVQRFLEDNKKSSGQRH